jgi:hypothetical protein
VEAVALLDGKWKPDSLPVRFSGSGRLARRGKAFFSEEKKQKTFAN